MQTKGQYRVGIDFNPSASDTVGRIKSMAAQFIDFVDGIDTHDPEIDEGVPSVEWTRAGEIRRLKALAQTAIEEAAMWAVKAATKPAPKE